MLASGPIGVKAEQILEYGRLASAVITKSISLEPSEGSPQPRIARIDHDGLINYEGGPNPGIVEFAKTIRAVKPQMECPLIGSLSPRTLRMSGAMERLAEQFEEAGADALELDFKYLLDEKELRVDFSLGQLADVLARLRARVRVPLIAKLAFGSMDIAELARAAEASGASAISAINTIFPAMKISVRRRRPVLAVTYGGLSGAPIRPLAVAAVYRIASAVRIPVIGVGGIMTGEDALEFLMAGACALQVFSVAFQEGPGAFPRIVEELRRAMGRTGFAAVREAIGVAQKAAGESELP